MWPNPQETADLVTFTEEILNRKLHFFVQWYSLTCFDPVMKGSGSAHSSIHKDFPDCIEKRVA